MAAFLRYVMCCVSAGTLLGVAGCASEPEVATSEQSVGAGPIVRIVDFDATADSSLVVEMTNPHSGSLWIRGYSVEKPLYTYETLDGDEWRRMGAWCATMADLRELKAGESVKFLVRCREIDRHQRVGVSWWPTREDVRRVDLELATSEEWVLN